MKILVTGGTGFVGRHVVENLKKVHKIYVIGRNPQKGLKKVIYIPVDITDKDLLIQKTRKLDFEIIIHIGSFVPKDPFFSSNESYAVNIIGTNNIAEVAKLHKVKKIVYLSSFSIYGKNDSELLTECSLANPVNPYALSKYCGERLLFFLYKQVGIDVVILRCAGIYGQDREEGAIGTFISQAIIDSSITVNNPFNSTDIIYIGDVVKAIESALEVNSFQIFNIGSGEYRTTLQLAQEITKLVKSKSIIKIISQDVHERIALNLDISKAKKILRFKPITLTRYILSLKHI
jgi:nucleoside-diphosphate-sugar epimerase